MKNQDEGVDVVSDSIVITDPYINGPLIDALKLIIEDRWSGKGFTKLALRKPPFIRMGDYVSRGKFSEPWVILLDMLHQAEHPIYLSKSESRQRPTVVMEKLMELAPDDMLLYCVVLAYFYAPTFEKAVTFLSEVFNIWTLKPFEERLFKSLETHFDIFYLSDVNDPSALLAPALAVGLVEIRND